MHKLIFGSSFLLLTIGAASCGDDEVNRAPDLTVEEADGDDTEYGADTNVVVTEDGTFVVTGDPNGACVDINGECIDIDQGRDRYCDDPDAQADIVVVDGEVVGMVCYPPESSGVDVKEVVVSEDGTATVPQNAGGSVIVFSEETDGEPIEGDMTLDAERTVLFGNGVDETILDGNLTIASNNSRTRGVTVTGNVHTTSNSNNSALAFCRVRGNLRSEGNTFTLMACDIFGNVDIEGNGAVLSDVGVGGQWNVNSSATCAGCYSFDDDDGDFIVGDGEVGDPLECGEQNDGA